MTFDIVMAGVGGQGVLSMAATIASAALSSGLHVKQAETHGMSQRGGAVFAHLRLSDQQIASDVIPLGSAALILGMEPLESLRYLDYLRPDGTIITAVDRVENITGYPTRDEVLAALSRIPGTRVIEAERLARSVGSVRAVNMVMVGAASPRLPLTAASLERQIEERFAKKGAQVVGLNLKAFRAGLDAGS